MFSHQINDMKNLIKIKEIKNFKTQKFKHRPMKFLLNRLHHHHCLFDSHRHRHSYRHHHRHRHRHRHHHPLQYKCTMYLNCLRLYSVPAASSALPGVSLSASTLQRSIISNSFLKMSLIIVVLLSILISHITDSKTIIRVDQSSLYLSRNNNLSEHFLKHILSQDNFNNKSLILDSKTKNITTNQTHINTYNKTNEHFSKYIFNKKSTLKTDHHQKTKLNVSNINQLNTVQIDKNPNNISDDIDQQYLLKIVMEGLGLKSLPDFQKANISQLEYATKYKEYLARIRKRNLIEMDTFNDPIDRLDFEESNASLSFISIPNNASIISRHRNKRSSKNIWKSPNKTIQLKFPLNIDTELDASDIEEANIRLLLVTSPALATSGNGKRNHRNHSQRDGVKNKKPNTFKFKHKNNSTESNHTVTTNKSQKHILNMKVYQLVEPKGRMWIDGRKIEITIDPNKMDETTSQWLQFDVTKAVENWLVNKQRNLGLEIQCDNCFRNGARMIDDASGGADDEENTDEYDLTPVLNIIGRLGTHREKRSKHHHNHMTEKPQKRFRKNDCRKVNQKCCRHAMEVVLKEIEGFEFIIQPKVFDAGYCRGRCPPRYHPAHHHALLQSLIWKQDRTKVPRPCCAPSKLIELEVLHVDEKDNEKLKISTWTDMRVLECACS